MKRLSRFWRALSDYRKFRTGGTENRKIVFYAESASSYGHFANVIDVLTANLNEEIWYITSQFDDPILEATNSNLKPLYFGTGSILTWAFSNMNAGIVVMTMPDLNRFHLLRSKTCDVHYAYIFHSIVSTHMIYQKHAFDHYDTIFSVGPHHDLEIRKSEDVYGTKPKSIVQHGYGRLESMTEEIGQISEKTDGVLRVLVAPSWGPTCILETIGVELVTVLLQAGFEVHIRPHPETKRRTPEHIAAIQKLAAEYSNCLLDMDVSSTGSLAKADVMISDWSGVALEYAFSRQRPVFFIDTDPKVNNEDFSRLGLVPVENYIRDKIGVVVSPDEIEHLPAKIRDVVKNWKPEQSREARDSLVYNFQRSGEIGAHHILKVANDQIEKQAASTLTHA